MGNTRHPTRDWARVVPEPGPEDLPGGLYALKNPIKSYKTPKIPKMSSASPPPLQGRHRTSAATLELPYIRGNTLPYSAITAAERRYRVGGIWPTLNYRVGRTERDVHSARRPPVGPPQGAPQRARRPPEKALLPREKPAATPRRLTTVSFLPTLYQNQDPGPACSYTLRPPRSPSHATPASGAIPQK